MSNRLFVSAVGLLLVCVTAGVGSLLETSRPAGAACTVAPRSPTSVYSHAGAWNTGFSGAVGGVYAQIGKTPPYVYSTSQIEVTDWVMLNDDQTGWAQIGWEYRKNSSPRVFSQVTTNASGTAWETKYKAAPATGAPYFTVLYGYVPGRFTFQVDGSQWIPDGVSGGYNPVAYFTPHDVQVFGETHNLADQMPRGYSSTAGHWDAHVYYGAWQDGWLVTFRTSSLYGLDPAAGNLAYYTGKQFYIWDTACAS